MKINVVGTSGSGKSTIAKKLADKLNLPYLEMDQLFWKPDWTEPTNQEFFPKLEQALDQPCWVLDGNYSRTNELKWQNVDIIVWVDYSFLRTFVQAAKRAFIRAITQVELWPGTGNKESFKKLLFSKDSIILWTLSNYSSNKKKYRKIMESKHYQHIEFIRVRSPKDIEWLLEILAIR